MGGVKQGRVQPLNSTAAVGTDRRSFLIKAGGAAATLALPGRTGALTADGGSQATEAARLNRLFERIFSEQMREAPQAMTSLGLDTGAGAWARSKLDDPSRAHADRLIQLQRRWLSLLGRINPKQLPEM